MVLFLLDCDCRFWLIVMLGLTDLGDVDGGVCFYGWCGIPLVGFPGFVALVVDFVSCALDVFLWFGRGALGIFGF